MIKRISEGELRGSFTVEAAFVVPVLVFCMVALIGAVLYLMNGVRAGGAADGIIYELERELASSDNPPDKLNKDVSSRVQGYPGARSAEAELTMDGSSVTVRIIIRMKTPGKGILGLLMKPIAEINLEKTSTLPKRENIRRIIQAVSDTVDMIKNRKE